jgi:hypothetical protein
LIDISRETLDEALNKNSEINAEQIIESAEKNYLILLKEENLIDHILNLKKL